jgi:hypothetical protein
MSKSWKNTASMLEPLEAILMWKAKVKITKTGNSTTQEQKTRSRSAANMLKQLEALLMWKVKARPLPSDTKNRVDSESHHEHLRTNSVPPTGYILHEPEPPWRSLMLEDILLTIGDTSGRCGRRQ